LKHLQPHREASSESMLVWPASLGFYLRVPCRLVIDVDPDGWGRGSRGRNDVVSHSQRAAVDGTRERGHGREAVALGAVV
jgi:hypothetical protein